MDDAAWQAFDRLARRAPALALEVADSWLEGHDVDLAALVDDELTALRRRLQIDEFLHRGQARGERALALFGPVARALEERSLPVVDPVVPFEIQERLGRFYDALHEARRLVAEVDANADATIEAVEAESAALEALLPGPAALDMPGYRVDLQLLRAQLAAARNAFDTARTAFEAARQRASALPGMTKLAEVVGAEAAWAFGQSADFDRALSLLLPLADTLSDEQGAVTKAEIELLLARAQLRVGDAFEAARTTDRAVRTLIRAGFADGLAEPPGQLVASWAAAARNVPGGGTERLRTFLAAATAWFTVAALRAQLGDSAAETRMETLRDLIGAAMARSDRIAAADDAAVDARMRAEMPEAVLPASTMSALPVPDDRLLTRLADARLRADAGEATAELLEVIDRLIEDARNARAPMVEGYALWTRAIVASDLGDTEAARAAYAEAVASGEREQDLKLVVEASFALALTLLEEGDDAAASTVCGRAIDVLEEQRRRVTPAYADSGFMGRSRHLVAVAVLLAFRLGDAQTLLARAERLKARALAARQLPSDDGTATDALLKDLAEVERALEATTDDASRDELHARRRLLWDRFSLERGQASAEPLDLARLQRRLDAETVILSYVFLAREVVLVSLVTDRDVATERIVLERPEALAEVLDRFAAASKRTPLDADLATLKRLLLPPSFEAAIERAARVLISPHQVLHQAPFHAWPWGTGYLIEHKQVAYVPNLTCLVQDDVASVRPQRNCSGGWRESWRR